MRCVNECNALAGPCERLLCAGTTVQTIEKDLSPLELEFTYGTNDQNTFFTTSPPRPTQMKTSFGISDSFMPGLFYNRYQPTVESLEGIPGKID